VTAGGAKDSARFRLVNDPRGTANSADLKAQFDFRMKVRDTVSAGVTALLTVRNVRQQLDDRVAKLKPSDTAAVNAVAAPFRARITAVETALYEVRSRSDEDNLVYAPGLLEQISGLNGMAGTMPARPTDQMEDAFKYLTPKLAKQLNELSTALKTDLPKVNVALGKAGAPAIAVSSVDILTPARNF